MSSIFLRNVLLSASSRFLVALLGLVLVVSGGFYVSNRLQQPAAAPVGDELARSKASAGGLYLVSIEPEGGTIPQGDLHAWVLTLTTADGQPVENATIQVDGGMPAHNHGLPTSPAVTGQLGGGRYRVEGVRFNMAGRWELRVAIDAPPGKDSAVFEIAV